MNSQQLIILSSQNGWTIYLIYFLLLVALFFVQKYTYLLDRKLNQTANTESSWEGKPWPLYSGMGLGLLLFLYNTFSPNDISFNLNIQNPFKWIILILIFVGLVGIVFESFTHFGIKIGVIRSLIYMVLMFVFFYAGFITGFLFVSILALLILLFFIKYFKKLLT